MNVATVRGLWCGGIALARNGRLENICRRGPIIDAFLSVIAAEKE